MSPIILALVALAFGASQTKKPERTHQRKTRAPASPELRPSTAMQVQPASVTATPVQNATQAALALRTYLMNGGKFGTARNHIQEVMDAQNAMGVTGEDGIVGPKTRKAARALGVTLPLRKAGQ